jgi:integrase
MVLENELEEARMLQHEVSEGFVRQVGRNWYMILTVDGQRRQRKTGTNDKMAAVEMLEEWKTQAKMGLREDTRLRYEAMRDEYIQKGGKKPDQRVLSDLDVFFKEMRIAAINVDMLEQFRTWRESRAQVLEYQQESIVKETAWRLKKAGKVSKAQAEKIGEEAKQWVLNATKATTNKRLTILRAMFNFLAKRGKIRKADIPSFPIAQDVDNKNRGFLEKADLPKILKSLSPNLRPVVQFIYETGMRSGAVENITWDMVDTKITELHIPGSILKNKEDLVLPLVDKKGEPLFEFVKDLKTAKRTNGRVFDTTNLRGEWRQACDKLGMGMFDKETRSYRGLKLHDFRRSACRNMIKRGVPQIVAMQISGHKTDSVFRRYAIMDKTAIQDALAQAS